MRVRFRRSVFVVVAVISLVAASCSRSSSSSSVATTTAPSTPTTAVPAAGQFGAPNIDKQCASAPLRATDTGVTASDITVEVMADTGSPLAPGIFQGDVDAITGFAKYINAHGGVGCRQLVVRTWDSKFTPSEAKDGQLDACASAFALVGDNSAFDPDVSAQDSCKDSAGAVTGLPDVVAFTVDTNESCSPVALGVNALAEACPIAKNTTRPFVRNVGAVRKLVQMNPGLHGVYLGNGDLPSTKLSGISEIAAEEQVGVKFDAKLYNTSTEPQTAYTGRVAYLKNGSNFVYGGTSDFAMVDFMKEALAQGVDPSKVVWACLVSCYTRGFLSTGGSSINGAYVWVNFVPFEEADTNPALNAYITTVGSNKVDTYGITSWQAAILFMQTVDQIVAQSGPNAITRAALLSALKNVKSFDAAGITGAHALGQGSPCYVLLQVKNGAFTRVWPTQRGTLDCDPANNVTVNVDPEQQAATELHSE